MAYLIDSNVLIQAKNGYYSFDICPGFWDWLTKAHRNGIVYSVERVREELSEGNDELARWIGNCSDSFFLPLDALTVSSMTKVSDWVSMQGYKSAFVTEFLNQADSFLIAQALAHSHTVVTHERLENGTKKIKIPNVCVGLNVAYTNNMTMLRDQQACFVLK